MVLQKRYNTFHILANPIILIVHLYQTLIMIPVSFMTATVTDVHLDLYTQDTNMSDYNKEIM